MSSIPAAGPTGTSGTTLSSASPLSSLPAPGPTETRGATQVLRNMDSVAAQISQIGLQHQAAQDLLRLTMLQGPEVWPHGMPADVWLRLGFLVYAVHALGQWVTNWNV